MSDGEIRTGDTAQLVFACCAPITRCIGEEFVMGRIVPATHCICPRCGYRVASKAVYVEGHGLRGSAALAWFRKPEPPEREEEIRDGQPVVVCV